MIENLGYCVEMKRCVRGHIARAKGEVLLDSMRKHIALYHRYSILGCAEVREQRVLWFFGDCGLPSVVISLPVLTL